MVFSIKKFRRYFVLKPNFIRRETRGGEIHPPERTMYVRNGFVIDKDEKTCRSVALRKIDRPARDHAFFNIIDVAESAALLRQVREQFGDQNMICLSAHSCLFFTFFRRPFAGLGKFTFSRP